MHYIGIEGRVTGPVSGHGSVDANRFLEPGWNDQSGRSVRSARGGFNWLVRPAVRGGLAYDGDESFHTVGASLTFAQRYGARFIVDRQPLSLAARHSCSFRSADTSRAEYRALALSCRGGRDRPGGLAGSTLSGAHRIAETRCRIR